MVDLQVMMLSSGKGKVPPGTVCAGVNVNGEFQVGNTLKLRMVPRYIMDLCKDVLVKTEVKTGCKESVK